MPNSTAGRHEERVTITVERACGRPIQPARQRVEHRYGRRCRLARRRAHRAPDYRPRHRRPERRSPPRAKSIPFMRRTAVPVMRTNHSRPHSRGGPWRGGAPVQVRGELALNRAHRRSRADRVHGRQPVPPPHRAAPGEDPNQCANARRSCFGVPHPQSANLAPRSF